MRKAFHTIDDVLRSSWGTLTPAAKAPGTDRVLKATRLEDSIYEDLRTGDEALSEIEAEAAKRLDSFPALLRDVFQSFYSLTPRRNEESDLSVTARKFNAPILEHITQSGNYPTLKAVCEGRELPSYEASAEFVEQTAGELDDLLTEIGGDKDALSTLEKLESARDTAQQELAGLLERMLQNRNQDRQMERQVIDAANRVESKQRQVQAVGAMIDANLSKAGDAVASRVSMAVKAAADKAEEVQNIIGAWSDEPGNLEKNEVNAELLALVRKSPVLKAVSRYLGRFRDIFAQGKRNGYAYGRGEKYSLELGRDLSRALTSELAMLATPETVPLFLRKYQRGQIKQYQRRESVQKGMGNIICCLDESDSTKGDPAAWGKAVALTLLEIAADSGRSFALIHFSGTGSYKTDLFRPGAYNAVNKMTAAEIFLGGGTNFATPMTEALRLMSEEGFENADIVFITDGECKLPEGYADMLRAEQAGRHFIVTGILLDKSRAGMDFSLKEFCQKIYRTSELLGDDLVRTLVEERV